MIINKKLLQDINDKITEFWTNGNVEIESGIMFPISRTQFRQSLQHSINTTGYISQDHDEVLDVSIDQVRFSIHGKKAIAAFCKKEMIDAETTIMKKKPLAKIDINEYGCRIRIASETKLNIAEYPINIDKSYRLKKRFSVLIKDSDYRIDYTIVRAGTAKNIQQVKFKPDAYEVEVEYIGKTKPPVLSELLNYTENVIKSLKDEQGNIVRTSERGDVLDEYFDIICKYISINPNESLYDILRTSPRKMFIGPQPVTLSMENIIEDGSINICGDGKYMVTEKADGMRYLLFVSNKGQIYLLNSRMEVKNTDMSVMESEYNGSIFDCEVTKIKGENGAMIILIFDCYFINKKTVFDKNLIERLNIVDAFCSKVKEGKSFYKTIRKKIFYNNVFKSSEIILSKTQEFEYLTDGLIFTPINEPAKLGGTWNHVFKWKPPHDNTIDFYTTYQKYINGQDYVVNDCKILNLYVGSSRLGAQEYFEKTNKGYGMCPFIPSNAGKYETHRTTLPFDKDTGLCKCANGDEILNKTIVEMSFDLKEEKWIPLRVRHDKTDESRSGNITANNIKNAQSVWNTIIRPITLELITGKKKINITDIGDLDNGTYYLRDKNRNQSLTLPMMTFHNHWVKNVSLLGKLGKKAKATSLLDLACGRGGDLKKWYLNGFKTVVGVDISEDNLNNEIDGAYKRLSELRVKEEDKGKLKYAFVHLDSSKPIDEEHINMIKNEYMKQLALTIWGYNKGRVVPPSMKSIANIGVKKFDVVSIQFALHYFFETKDSLRNVLSNISNNLNNGGFFIGTCFDGQQVNNFLKDINKGESKSGYKNDKLIWSIKKNYDEYNPKKPYGNEIEVYIESINKAHKEYLVDYNVLVKELATKNLFPLQGQEMQKFGFDVAKGSFEDLFRNMEAMNGEDINKRNETNYKDDTINKAYEMANSPDERLFSFMNMWFIFRKAAPKTKKTKNTDT